tara:strand:+ start:1272 stop:2582 length:1311 start_codon:yes stop_codon:yes gene_type:complete
VLEMGTTISPSDFTEINPDYTQGRGFYTNANEVADLLQIPDFSATTFPTTAQVGAIIKRTEGIVDDKVKRSFRPIITKDEHHNFEFTRGPNAQYYGGYVGFIQLKQMKVRKIISLQLWQGSQYEEIASAQAKIRLLDNFRDLHSIILQLPNSGVSFEMVAENTLTDLANDEFCNTFGAKTTVAEIVSLVNESFPSASQFTGATAPKSLTSSNLSISDFFYAAKNKENGKEIFISSLLMGDDGADCTIKATIKQSCTTTNTSKNLTVADSSKLAVGMIVSGTGITGTVAIESITNSTTVVLDTAATASGTNTLTFTTEDLIPSVCDLTVFTDKEDLKRLGSYWTINEEGRIFFLRDYPYHTNNSVIVSYIAGDNRVPSAIHEATTKLVAAEIIRMDDQSVLIAETGANISAKEKYDILKKEAMDILKGKGDLVYFLD